MRLAHIAGLCPLLLAAFAVQAQTTVPDFVHAHRPHLMGKNPYTQITPDTSFYTKVRLGQMPLLVILADFPDSARKAGHDQAYFDDLVFGPAHPNVNGYWREVSYGKFSFSKAGITSWLRLPQPASYYFEASQARDGYVTLAADAARAAAQAGFPFRNFDKDGNGKVTQDELVILLVVADHPPIGFPQFLMTRPGRQSASGVMVGDGTLVDTVAMRVEENLYSGTVRFNHRGSYVSYYAHELGHAAHALPDLYDDNFGEDGADYFTLMSTAGLTVQPHIDPWAKMHLGWLTPKVVTQSGWYTLNSTEKSPEALIVYNPAKNGTEYFIIENRFTRDSLYEVPDASTASLLESGLVIWHVTEFYDNMELTGNRGRQMIGMKLARGATSMNVRPFRGAWDGADPLTAHNFTDNATPRNARWADGTPSRVQILNIPEAASQVRIYINVDADPAAAPRPLASPDTIAFEAPKGQVPASKTIRLSNAGGGTMSFTATTDVPWLAVRRTGGQPASGSLGAGEAAIPWLEVSMVASAASELAAGTYTARVQIATNGGSVSIPVSYTVVPVGPPPFTSANILHGATGQPGPVAPGLILNLKVNGYGPADALDYQLNADGLVDTSLGGTSVLFDGQPAPVLYASSTLVKVVAPYALADKTSTEVVIQYNDVQSAPVTMEVVPARPGIFLVPGTSNRGLVLNQDGTLNAPDNPAAQGSRVSFLVTGEGQTDPPGVDGKPALEEFPKPALPVVVRILGVESEIYYMGTQAGAPAGQLEVFAVVPSGRGFGASALRITIGDSASPFAVMYVSP